MKNQDIRNVYAWDGSMKWSRDGEYVRLANKQQFFETGLRRDKNRKPEGMIRYYIDENGVIKHEVMNSYRTEFDWFDFYKLWKTY